MKIPASAPRAGRSVESRAMKSSSVAPGLSQQGCNFIEWAGCAAAIAACTASGPGLIPCLLAAAPGCVKCVS